MKNLFKKSKESTNNQSPKKIPDYYFENYINFHIATSSRLSPSFDEMLNLPASRQTFMRYLRRERMQELFLCLRELSTTSQCDKECHFLDMDPVDDVPVSLSRREALEWRMNVICKQVDSGSCRFAALYTKYFAGVGGSSGPDRNPWQRCFQLFSGEDQETSEDDPQCQMVDDILHQSHLSPLQSFLKLQQSITEFLSNSVYPNYLRSSDHLQYQLQMLSSGLNSLHLADFIYSNEYLMIITEFLDMKGMSDYLSFLLGVINLGSNGTRCSFNDALELYSRYFVMDSVQYIELPVSVTNSIINHMCQLKSTDDPGDHHTLDTTLVFGCAFRPIYLFLEQFWLPEFLACRTYQNTVHQLGRIVNSRPRQQLRHRNHHSENIDLLASRKLATEDETQVSPGPECAGAVPDNVSVHSEPTISIWNGRDRPSASYTSHVWWPSPRLDSGVYRNMGCRPMSLGSFDDLGRYQPINDTGRNFTVNGVFSSSSSDILGTISELGLGLWTRMSTTGSHRQQPESVLSPDEKARQIINDVHTMTLRNL